MSISRVFNPRNCDNGIEFEAYVVDYLNKFGLNARRTKGDDGGVDVIATYSHNNVDYNFYIQCKFQNTGSCGKRLRKLSGYESSNGKVSCRKISEADIEKY